MAENWIFSLLFGALGLVAGAFISSAYPAIFKNLFHSFKVRLSSQCESNGAKPSCCYEKKASAASPSNASQIYPPIHPAPVSHHSRPDAALHVRKDHLQRDTINKNAQAGKLLMQESTEKCLGQEDTLANGTLKPDPFDPSKRQGYLSWDDYFMAIAFLSAHRSKDPNRQVGACLVSQDRVILGIGYNGFPRGCADDDLPWAKMSADGDPLKTKYPYVCHAEVNAILNKNHASAYGQRLYVTMFPCNECAKIIIQAGVAEVVYFVGKSPSSDCSYIASCKLLAMAGVKVWQHQPAQWRVILDFK